ncbi:DeoR/GlpR family DNA-binding transcription regulator [Nocardioides aurantiacus]|uniref:Lactose phosphotransferase system repressor n=1 Tax=Nocardioides aurantiacus TaxID=86796 RepID=A0A3N2CYH0_9ACTN|nr:DeoR/GlpR family DNA-binding transcription regulator [Nocardioides aurantiacus]ROR92478.1 DeoR family transcriptional regulator [Nocardioides aurantiacus]
MEADERQRRILALARHDGRVEVARLADDLRVAPETVRRDLRQLVERGMLQRVHGGAHPVEGVGYESDVEQRSHSQVAEKRRIAVAAAARLEGAESVYVDEGVTPQLVAEAIAASLRPDAKLTVVTSSLLAAGALAHVPQVTVMLLGGRLRGRTMATVDHWATRMLRELVIDLAYLGANGISRDHGLTTPDPAVAAVKAQVVASARRRIFVGVHTKFNVSSFCRFADIPDFEALVTDTGVSVADAHRFGAMGPHVVRA